MKSTEQIVEETVRAVLARASFGDPSGYGQAAAKQSSPSASLPASLARPSYDITLDLAEQLMKLVEQRAREIGIRVVTAVCDSHSNPVAVRCMDGAYLGSFDVALHKTYTAIAFQMSTEELGKLSQPGESLYGVQFTNQGRIVIFGGGVPLQRNGHLIGAFGVSGGSAEQDTYLADYAEEKFQELCSREEFKYE